MTRNEAQTRKEIIDKRLDIAGWDVMDPSQVTEELDIWVGLPQGVREPKAPFTQLHPEGIRGILPPGEIE